MRTMADGGKMRQQREVAKETGDAKEVQALFSAPFCFFFFLQIWVSREKSDDGVDGDTCANSS